MRPHESVFQKWRKPVIGMVHLLPLPGTEAYARQGLGPVLDRALEEARLLDAGGVDAILLQNTGDLPPRAEERIETVAYMAAIGREMRNAVKCSLGINIMANGTASALSVAHAIGADFVRIKIYVGAVISVGGVIHGSAPVALAFRRHIEAPQIAIAADVYDRTSAALGNLSLELACDMAARMGFADALVLTGQSVQDSLDRIRQIKVAMPRTVVLAGGGTTAENVHRFFEYGDGVIVGSTIKDTGTFVGKVDSARLAVFMDAANLARNSIVD